MGRSASVERILSGVTVAMVTPYESPRGSVDGTAAAVLASWISERGVDGILVAGTTGEITLISQDEEVYLIHAVADAVPGGVALLAGLPAGPVGSTVTWGRALVDAGAEALLAPPPHYHRGDPEGLAAYYSAIASSIDSHIIVYNVPIQTGVEVPPAVIARLAREHSNIVAVKATTLTPWYAAEVLRASEGSVGVLAGVDEAILLSLVYGARGAIVASANIVPDKVKELLDSWHRGDFMRAVEAQREIERLMWALRAGRSLQGALKVALSLMGVPVKRYVRPPLPQESDDTVEEIRRRLIVAGLLDG